MLSTSLIPNSIKSQYSQLEKQQYWQNLGNDINIALFCSIIHYFLNQKNHRPIQKFLNINDKDLKEDFRQIHKLIIQSLEIKNPIQQFFDSLSENEKNISQIGQFFDQLCRIHLLKSYEKINLKSLAIFLQIKINFLHNNEKYGSGKDEILLVQSSDSFYFIIPYPQLKTLPHYQCNTCNQTQNCLKINCQHHMCLNCIQTQKNKIQEDFFVCSCGQIVLKNSFLEDAIQEIKNIQQINEYVVLIKEYYEVITEEDQMIRELGIGKDHVTIKSQKNPVQRKVQNSDYTDIEIQNETCISPDTPKQRSNKNNQKDFITKSHGYQANNLQTNQQHNYNQYYSQYESRDNQDLNKQLKPQIKSQKALDNFQEEKSKPNGLIEDIEKQNLEQQQQLLIEKNLTIQSDKCTYCSSPFDNYNLRQGISCQQHVLGVCCFYANYKQCPQCEKINDNQKSYNKPQQQNLPRHQNHVPDKFSISNQILMNNGHYPRSRQDQTMKPMPQPYPQNPKMQECHSKVVYERYSRVLLIEGNYNGPEAMSKTPVYQQRVYYEVDQSHLIIDGNTLEEFRNMKYLQSVQNYNQQIHKRK